MEKKYPLFKVHAPVDETLAKVREVLDSGFVNEGLQVAELAASLRKILAAEHLVLTNSCTSALTLALKLCGARPGTDVVTTPMTCVATNTPIANLGSRVVWADVDPLSGMIDPADVASKITPRTVAVVAVAWAGSPPDLGALREVCRKRQVKLVLDAAHAFGAEYTNSPVHRYADFTCYSFQAIKHFTTGDGGAIVCCDAADHQRAKTLKWFGLDRDAAKDAQGNWRGQQWDVDVAETGYKFNMNNIAAAVGLASIQSIHNILGTHRANAALYDRLFENVAPIRPAVRPAGGRTSAWVYTMLAIGDVPRDEILRRLNAEGIMAGVVHVPNDEYSAFLLSRVALPGVRQFSAAQFSLPCGWWLGNGDVRHIASRVLELSK